MYYTHEGCSDVPPSRADHSARRQGSASCFRCTLQKTFPAHTHNNPIVLLQDNAPAVTAARWTNSTPSSFAQHMHSPSGSIPAPPQGS
jgi:hypothetical protein